MPLRDSLCVILSGRSVRRLVWRPHANIYFLLKVWAIEADMRGTRCRPRGYPPQAFSTVMHSVSWFNLGSFITGVITRARNRPQIGLESETNRWHKRLLSKPSNLRTRTRDFPHNPPLTPPAECRRSKKSASRLNSNLTILKPNQTRAIFTVTKSRGVQHHQMRLIRSGKGLSGAENILMIFP